MGYFLGFFLRGGRGSILLGVNKVIRLDAKRNYRVTKVIRFVMLIKEKVLAISSFNALFKSGFFGRKEKGISTPRDKGAKVDEGERHGAKRRIKEIFAELKRR